MNSYFLSGHHFCHPSTPFRAEYGFFKLNPYIYKTLGPYGKTSADINARTSSIIDHNFSTIYWLNHQILPQPVIINHLKEIEWSNEKLDFFIPPWLFDKRLEKYAGTTTRIMSHILSEDNFFVLNCRWMPLKITQKMILDQHHIKYCSIVNRLFKLEMLRSELETECKRLKNNKEYANLTKKYHIIINRVIEWQSTMVGTVLYMQTTGRFLDSELEHDFYNSKLGTYDEGFHWVMHLGELHDVTSIIKILPFFSPVEKRSQKQRRIRGQQTDAGSINDMRGTFFDNDKYICCITNVLNRGMLNPNKVRRVEMILTEPLKKLRGIITTQEDLVNDQFKKKTPTKTKTSEIESLCMELNSLLKILKSIKKDMIVSYHDDVEMIENQEDLQNNADYVYIRPIIIEKITKIMTYKKYQIIKAWRMETPIKDHFQLFNDFNVILDGMKNYKISFTISKLVKTFIGPSPSFITSIITKMDKIVRESLVRNVYTPENAQKMKKYASQILIFSDDILKKYLSKDFVNELLKSIKTELHEIVNLKWKLFDSEGNPQLSSCIRRFLRCNEQEIEEIQNEKINSLLDDDDNFNNDNDDNDETANEYSTSIHMKKGRAKQEDIYIPSWSGFAQKKVYNGEAKVLNPQGGHNAHRFLDFIMRMFSVSLLGSYPKNEYHPSFDTVMEIYRFIQFDYPSIDDFCTWIETILPFDVKILEKKKNSISNLLKNKSSKYQKLSIPFVADELQEVYKLINDKEGSQCRRWFIVYILREHHIFFVGEIPSLNEKIEQIYQWNTIHDNVYKTMDINRNLIDEVICDIRHHEKTCLKDGFSHETCNHCKRWSYAIKFFHPKLLNIYRKWPILFAIDIACQTQKEKDIIIESTSASTSSPSKVASTPFIDENIYFANKLNFPINNFQSSQPFNGDMHVELLSFCPRPMMRTFEQNIIEQLSEIDNIFSSPYAVFEKYTTEKKRQNVEYNRKIMDLSRRAVKEYEWCQDNYMKYTHESAEKIIDTVVSKFPPDTKIGLEWMIPLFGISLKSIRKIEKARQLFEKEQTRTLAQKVFLRLLSKHPKDFFILRTFYNIIVHYNRIKLFPTTYSIMKNTIKSVVKKVGGTFNQDIDTLPEHLVKYFTCFPHGTMQVALVGSELGIEGEKNTRSYGNDGITINPNDGKIYCTISGKRMEKRDPNDISWICINKPNTRINMLGKILQLYDVLYVMCEYCGNIMHFYWERVCAGGPSLWCGQCIRGQKKQAQWLGYQWISTNSVSPCARSIFLGGLPTFVQGCVICTSPKTIPETLTYHLVWVDTHESGRCFMAYVGICPVHKRSYHLENWDMISLNHLTYLTQGQYRSFIVANDSLTTIKTEHNIAPPVEYFQTQNITRNFYRPGYTNNSGFFQHTKGSLFDVKQIDSKVNDNKKYLLEKQNDNETTNDDVFEEIELTDRQKATIKKNELKDRFKRMRYNLRSLKKEQ